MSQRREARRFEPPPWEKGQFEELERRRAEEHADLELDEALADLDSRPLEPEEAGDQAPLDDAPRNVQAAGGSAPSGPDDAAVAAMLAQLAAEEPGGERSYWKAGVAVAVLLGALGFVLVVWGIAGMLSARRSGQVGLAGGTGLIVIGGLFIGACVWVVTSNLRKRGVI